MGRRLEFKLARRPVPWLLFGALVFLYLHLFILPHTAIWRGGDQTIQLLNAMRMREGQVIYRDFFHFLLPGTELVYLALFKIFGLWVWIPNVMLIVLGLGFLAICLDTVCGVLFAKVMYAVTGGKINPLIGAAGISAFPMAARVVAKEGNKFNKKSYLLMHAMGANAGGQIGSVIAAAVMLSVLAGMGVIR